MLRGLAKFVLLTGLLGAACADRAAAQSAVDRAGRAEAAVRAERLRDAAPAPAPSTPGLALPSNMGQAAAQGQGIVVGAVRIEGTSALPVSAFAPAIEPYLGRTLGEGELRRLAGDVAQVARNAGYGLATAQVPQQKVLGGVLRVAVDEGRIDGVEVTGDGKASVEPLLARLVTGKPVLTRDLERQLLLAGDAAGVTTSGARIEDRKGRRILCLKAVRRRAAGRLTVDNWGSREVGPVMATLSYDLNGIAAADDSLSVSGSLTPRVREFASLSAYYTKKLNRRGTEMSVGASWYRVRPGGSLAQDRLAGETVEADMALSHPLVRTRKASLWGGLEGMLLDSNLDQAGLPARRDRIRTVSATLSGNVAVAGGRLRGRVALVEGLPALGATREGAPLASRSDGSAVFTKLEFWGEYRGRLAGPLSLTLAATGQLASRPLLMNMEMGLGGRRFLRGYDYRELSGDDGIAGSAELRWDVGRFAPLRTRLELYGYADAGRVTNLRGGAGGGSLASAGGGMRLHILKATDVGLELGVPLKATAYDPSPRPRFSFTFGQGF